MVDHVIGGYLAGDPVTPEEPPPTPVPVGDVLTDIRWSLLVRRPDLTFAGALEFTRAELRPRFIDVGTWVADIPWDGDTGGLAAELLEPGAGIAVAANGGIIFSGPVTRPIRELVNDRRTLRVAGTSDLQHLADRLAHPTPADATPPYNGQAYDVRTGPAETIIKEYVDVNAAGGALLARRVTGLIVDTDLGTGATIRGRARWQPLDKLIRGLAIAGGLGYDVVQDGTDLIFSTYLPVDRRDEVVFAAELGNLESYTYDVERPDANYVFVAGAGEGTAREVRERTDATSVADWGRIEAFKDARDTDDNDELDQRADEVLAEGAAKYSLAATVIDTRQHQWAPVATAAQAATYNLGDRVTAIVDGVEVPEIIRELSIVITADGSSITPLVSTPGRGRVEESFYARLLAHIRALNLRIDDLERR